jgi:hypothetical protein
MISVRVRILRIVKRSQPQMNDNLVAQEYDYVNATPQDHSALVEVYVMEGERMDETLIVSRQLLLRQNTPVTKVGLLQWLQQNTATIKRPQDGATVIVLRPELSQHFGLQDQLQQYDPAYLQQQRSTNPVQPAQAAPQPRQYVPQYYYSSSSQASSPPVQPPNGAPASIDLTGDDDEQEDDGYHRFYSQPVVPKPVIPQTNYTYHQHQHPQQQQTSHHHHYQQTFSNEPQLDEKITHREHNHRDHHRPPTKRDRRMLPLPDTLVGDAIELWTFCFMFRKPLFIYPFPFLDLQQALVSHERQNPLLHAIFSELLLYLLTDNKSTNKSDQHKCISRMKKIFNETKPDLREMDLMSRRSQVNRDAILYMMKYDLCLVFREYFKVFVIPLEKDKIAFSETKSKAVADLVYREEPTTEKTEITTTDEQNGNKNDAKQKRRNLVLPPENAPQDPNQVEVPDLFENLSASDKLVALLELVNRCMMLQSMRDYTEEQIDLRKQLQRENTQANQDAQNKSKELIKIEPQRAKEITEEMRRGKRDRDRRLAKTMLHDYHIRSYPIGMDRFYNRYWWVTGGFIGLLLVETRNERNTDDPMVKAQRIRRQKLGLVDDDNEDDFVNSVKWGYYDSLEQVDALMRWLDRRGEREANLYSQLEIYYETMSVHMSAMADGGTHKPDPISLRQKTKQKSEDTVMKEETTKEEKEEEKKEEETKEEKSEETTPAKEEEEEEKENDRVTTPSPPKKKKTKETPPPAEPASSPEPSPARPVRRRKRISKDEPVSESDNDSTTGERRSRRLQIKRKADDEPQKKEDEDEPARKYPRTEKSVRKRKPTEKVAPEEQTTPKKSTAENNEDNAKRKRGRPKKESDTDSDSDSDEELRNFEDSEFLPAEINDDSYTMYVNYWAQEVDEVGEESEDESDEDDEESDSEGQ